MLVCNAASNPYYGPLEVGLFLAIKHADRVGRLNPWRRDAQPEAPAKVAPFLASDDASLINGQALAVDGGLSSSHPMTR